MLNIDYYMSGTFATKFSLFTIINNFFDTSNKGKKNKNKYQQ